MFQPIQQLRYDQGEGAVLKALAASGISLIAAHTNLDNACGGVLPTAWPKHWRFKALRQAATARICAPERCKRPVRQGALLA